MGSNQREQTHNDVLYSLGFVVGHTLSWVPAHFKKVEFACCLYVNPNARYGLCTQPNRRLMIIGEPVHPDYPNLDHQGIAHLLATNWLDIQSEIDKLAGRFAIILVRETNEIEIQADAIGLRSIYFTTTSQKVTVAGSHAKLVACAANDGKAREFRQPHSLGYPGIDTLYADVYRLPPNNALSLSVGKLRRFFPVAPIPSTSLEQSWDYAFDRARQVVLGLTNRSERPVLVSLTGGLDSRSTLAATRGLWDKLTFFTYVSGQHPQHELDVKVASDIAAILGLRHQTVSYKDIAPNPIVMNAIKSNTFSVHQWNLASAYFEIFGNQRYIHVRTNLMELARSNLYEHHGKNSAFLEGPNTAEKMAEYYCLAGKREPSETIAKAFIKQFSDASMPVALEYASPWDLFFIEHRMGSWQSGVVAESDVSFDTVIAFNSRETIKRFMGVPQELRSKSNYLQKKIRALVPEISEIPINPRSYVRSH